jgi:hypothetical protein
MRFLLIAAFHLFFVTIQAQQDELIDYVSYNLKGNMDQAETLGRNK